MVTPAASPVAAALASGEPGWLTQAAREVDRDLADIARRYPGRMEFRDGKLRVRK